DVWDTDTPEWDWYGTVEVQIGDRVYDVGAVIGVPEYLRGTAQAAGGDTHTPYLSAWYAESADWSLAPADDGTRGVPPELAQYVIAAIDAAAPKLWRLAQAAR